MKHRSLSRDNLRQTLKYAEKLGCKVEKIRRSGEIRISHRDLPRPIRINGRRKDVPRKLESALRRIV
jgi:hypothetical protein